MKRPAAWSGRTRRALLATSVLVAALGAGEAHAQSRQPLFEGNPVESIARFGDRIVRSLRGGQAAEKRRSPARNSRRSARKPSPIPAIGAVPLPERRPDTAIAAGAAASAATAGAASAETSSEDQNAVAGTSATSEAPVSAAALPEVQDATAAKVGAGAESGHADGLDEKEPKGPVSAPDGKASAKTAQKDSDSDTGDSVPLKPKASDQADATDGDDATGDGTDAVSSSDDTQDPEPTGEPTVKSGGEDAVGTQRPPADAEDETAREDTDRSDAEGDTVGGVPRTTDILEGDEAQTLPVAEIPTPEKRPQAPDDTAPAAASTPSGSDGVDGGDAPNSTEKLKSRIPDVTPAASVAAATAVEDAKLCERELKERGVEFTVGESIAEGECGVLRPVAIKTLSSGVSVRPDTQLLCRSALALDEWMSAAVTKAAEANFPGDPVVRFDHASTYVCRPRASETKISEHARGSAIDIAGFVFKSGRTIGVEKHEDGTPEAKFQKAIREGACGPFKTVLGPGTDADHSTHFHLDIAARRNGYEYCK